MATPEPRTGDCFVVAFKLAIENGWTLCHGTVVRPADGLHHEHAWCEYTWSVTIPATHLPDHYVDVTAETVTAIDKANGNDVALTATLYRAIGKAHNVTEYTADEARAHALRTGHYGPWKEV